MAYDLGPVLGTPVGVPTMDRGTGDDATTGPDTGTDTIDTDTTVEPGATTGTGGTGTTGTSTGPFVIVDLANFGGADDIDIPTGEQIRDLEFSQLETAFTVNLVAATGAPTGTITDEPDGTGVDGPGTGGGDGSIGNEDDDSVDNESDD